MPKGNPNPRVENLTNAGKGRKKLDNQTVAIRMAAETREVLERQAERYGCFLGGKPYIGGLLAKLGAGELLIVPPPPPSPGE